MKNLMDVLRDRNLGLLLAGRIVSSGGDYLYQIALSIALYQYTGGKSFYVGLFWIVRLIPALFLAPITGGLADRLGYRRSMLIGDFGRLAAVTLLAIVLTPTTWVLIYPLAFVVTSFGTLFRPASVGIIPLLVKSPEQRLAANAATMQAESLATIVGSAVGGVIAGLGYINPLLFLDAATFLVSAGCLWLIHPRTVTGTERAVAVVDEEEPEEDMGSGFVAGLKGLTRRPILVFTAQTMVALEIAYGALVVWIVPYSAQSLGLGNAGVGYLFAAMGVGSVLGGVIAASVGGNIRLDTLLTVSIALSGVALVVFGGIHVATIALLSILLFGLAQTVEYTSEETLVQQAVPENAVGRAIGTIDSLLFVMMLVGTATSGLVATAIGLTPSIVGMGFLVLITTGVSWVSLKYKTAGQPTAEGLTRIPAFAAVPENVREWAVRRMVRERLPAGAVVIHQGEEGDRFYTIARGRVKVEVEQGGQRLTRELGPGDFFGEIALLQNVPRTATVRTLEKTTLWSMTREDFEELQSRTSDFKDSLWETASARMEETMAFKMAGANRA